MKLNEIHNIEEDEVAWLIQPDGGIIPLDEPGDEAVEGTLGGWYEQVEFDERKHAAFADGWAYIATSWDPNIECYVDVPDIMTRAGKTAVLKIMKKIAV